MRILLAISVAALLSLSSCSNSQLSTESTTKSQAVKQAAAPAVIQKKIGEIDFSNMPGAIKPGAFGFYFGITEGQITKAGIPLEVARNDEQDFVYVASAQEAPMPWSDAEKYSLVFADHKLVKIVAFGRDITNDATGSVGKEKYAQLLAALVAKYGPAKMALHRVGISVYLDSDEFYQCLNYKGCGYWTDGWEIEKDKNVVIGLNSAGQRGQSFIEIVYEANPEYGAAIAQRDEQSKQADAKGL